MTGFLLRLAISAFGLWVAAKIVPGMGFDGPGSLVLAAFLLGFVNAFVRPLLLLLTLPLTIVTLGLFILVINALLFWFVGSFVEGFHVSGFWAGFFGAILYSLITWAANALLFEEQPRS